MTMLYLTEVAVVHFGSSTRVILHTTPRH